MRHHWIGLGLAITLGLALFFGGGWGVAQMSNLSAEGLTVTSVRGVAALGVLTVVGLLLGVLMVAPRVSPLAAGLPGLVFLAWTGLLGLSGTLAVRLIPMSTEPAGIGFQMMLVSGVLALLGFAMIIPLFVPSRWWQDRGDDDDGQQTRGGGGDRGGDRGEDAGLGPRRPRRRPRRPPQPPGLLQE
jgi:hypothetical protein